jgi:hypothetical protein
MRCMWACRVAWGHVVGSILVVDGCVEERTPQLPGNRVRFDCLGQYPETSIQYSSLDYALCT